MQRGHIVTAALVGAALFLAGYFGSPWLTLLALKNALPSGDRDRIESLVDFPALRENLKAEFGAMMAAQMQSDVDLRDNPFAGLGMAIAPTIVNNIVDSMVTPTNLAHLAGASKVSSAGPDTAVQPSSSSFLKKPLSGLSYSYSGLNRFRAKPTDGPTIVLERRGLFSWKLIRLDFPDSFFNQTTTAGDKEASDRAAAAAMAADAAASAADAAAHAAQYR
jgi:hypothetical protein